MKLSCEIKRSKKITIGINFKESKKKNTHIFKRLQQTKVSQLCDHLIHIKIMMNHRIAFSIIFFFFS